MRKLQFIVITIGLTLIIGCKVNCPGFDEKILAWMPYQANDMLEFINTQNDSTFSLKIDSVVIMHTTHYSTNEDCGGCDDFIGVNTYSSGELNLYIDILLNESEITSEYYEIIGSIFGDYYSNYTEKSDYELNGIIYDEVKIFENEKVENNNFTKLIVAKRYGIIELTDKNGIKWTPNNLKYKTDDELEATNFNETSC